MNRRAQCLAIFFAVLSVSPAARAGQIFQNFEPGHPVSAVSVSDGRAGASVVDRSEAVHFGRHALKLATPSNLYWTSVTIASPEVSGYSDFKQFDNDRLTFWMYALPHRNCYVYGCDGPTDNNASVTFYDTGNYQNNGFEVWTVKAARYAEWSRLTVLFSQLPLDFDLTRVTKIEIKNYSPGVYYFDDIHVEREDRVYQSFENVGRPGVSDSDFGWVWNAADTGMLSGPGEPVHEGGHSWKLVLNGKWGGGGIQSQEQRYHQTSTGSEQTFWHVDLNPEVNDRLIFWIHALPESGMDNNLAVQFYDNGDHSTDETKAEVWTKETARYGQWTQLTVLFKDLPASLNLKDINKIQFLFYWPGTYYIDDIRASAAPPVLEEQPLSDGIVKWNTIPGAVHYRLMESLNGPEGPWKTIYSGPEIAFTMSRLGKTWLRVRWEQRFLDAATIPYASAWSEVAIARSRPVFLKYNRLQAGLLDWDPIPQTDLYEIASAHDKNGPWQTEYLGAHPISPAMSVAGRWYRIRGVRLIGGNLAEFTAWSRPQQDLPGAGFVKAVDTALKEEDGNGEEIVLHGVNLGGLFINEPWMTGLGLADSPAIVDDYSLRQVLTTRFGLQKANALLKVYQENYINDDDFNRLFEQGVDLVRLPFYYRNLQDENGQWNRNAQGQIDFSPLDRIVNACADRGIYVLLDLHGAPGGQSVEFHTGRQGVNALFNSTVQGETFRQRTEDIWIEVAKHYSQNKWVLGYDLLNEPVGAPAPQDLWSLYDRLYGAVRAVDPGHLIMMEGIWDWDTLPLPSDMGWENVVYQFHYYNFGFDEDFVVHKDFMDDIVSESMARQRVANVPVMVGEFHGFSLKAVWDYYLEQFSGQNWSWTLWSWKYNGGASNWGVFNHLRYDETLPKFRTDSLNDLTRKLSKYRTADYHIENVALAKTIADHSPDNASGAGDAPRIFSLSSWQVSRGQEFRIFGRNFGETRGNANAFFRGRALPVISWSDTDIRVYMLTDETALSGPVVVETETGQSDEAPLYLAFPPSDGSGMTPNVSEKTFLLTGQGFGELPGRVAFYPAPCDSLPPDFLPCNQGEAGISLWSDTRIEGFIPPDAADLTGRYNVFSSSDEKLYPTMIQPGTPQEPIQIISPLPGSAIATEAATFQWTNRTDVTEAWLAVGTSQGGAQILNWAQVWPALSKTVNNIPLTGSPVYLEMWYKVSGKWIQLKAVFQTKVPPSIQVVEPVPGETLTTDAVTFEWTGRPGVTEAWLAVGTTQGGAQILNWAQVWPNLSKTVSGIPLNGFPVYFEMWYRAYGKWIQLKAVYQTENHAGHVELTSPLPGSILTNSSVTFQWTNRTDVTEAWLGVGTTPGGTQILNWTQVWPSLSKTVNGIPLTGIPVYFEMWYKASGNWQMLRTLYHSEDQRAGTIKMVSPVSGAVLDSQTVTFEWTNGAGVTEAWLAVGTSSGGAQILNWTQVWPDLSKMVNGIPLTGGPVYFEMWYKANGKWIQLRAVYQTLKP